MARLEGLVFSDNLIYVKSPHDLPKDDWYNYEWEYKYDRWEACDPPTITFDASNEPTEMYRYKKKAFPSDEYIERHLWGNRSYSPTGFTTAWKRLDKENTFMLSVDRSVMREWFRDKPNIPKDAIKDKIDE